MRFEVGAPLRNFSLASCGRDEQLFLNIYEVINLSLCREAGSARFHFCPQVDPCCKVSSCKSLSSVSKSTESLRGRLESAGRQPEVSKCLNNGST